MIEYYLPGVDISLMTDYQLASKLSHLSKIRRMEGKDTQAQLLAHLYKADKKKDE